MCEAIKGSYYLKNQMKSSLKNITPYLLIPSILEIIDPSLLLIEIPGSPLSLGRLCFVLAGITGLHRVKYLKNNGIFSAFIFIQLGLYSGAILSTDILGSLSQTFAFTILIFSAAALSFSWRKVAFHRLLDISMLALFSYWTIYILKNIISGNNLLVYSSLFLDDEVVNHHITALRITISGIYLAVSLVGKSKGKSLLGYFVIIVSITLCLLTESRSNTLFMVIAGLMVFFSNNKIRISFFTIIIPLLLVAFVLYLNYVSTIDAISVRFNLSDVDYQKRTTESRFLFIILAFESFINNPFGRGISDIKLQFDSYRNFLVHNQYLTFILAGGIFSLFGIIGWLRNIIKLSKLVVLKKWKRQTSKIDLALLMNLIVFNMTLLTIDFSGLMFFFQLSFAIYLMSRYMEIQSNLKHNNRR